MKKMLLAVALLTVSLLVACAPSGAPSASAPSPASQVYAAKLSYEAALIVAVKYNQLPRCTALDQAIVCSKASIVAELRKANTAAIAALDAAETIVRAPGGASADAGTAIRTALSTVQALQTVLKTYGIT